MEVEKVAKEIKKQFPDCPNPIHHPIIFSYYYKLYQYYKSRNESKDITTNE